MVERREVEPDMAFIDLHMPRMNGFDLLVALTTEAKVTLFPMWSSSTLSTAQSDSRAQSICAAPCCVVVKPETVVELYAVLQTTIEAVRPWPAASRQNPRPGKSSRNT